MDCKPGSVRSGVATRAAKIIHLGAALPRRSSALTRALCAGPCGPMQSGGRPVQCPYSSLLREGLASPPVTRLSRVGSYPTISTLPGSRAYGASATRPGTIGTRRPRCPSIVLRRCDFCCAFPRVAPGRCYRLPCPVEPGLSSRGRCVSAGDLPSTSGRRTLIVVRAERLPIGDVGDVARISPVDADRQLAIRIRFGALPSPDVREASGSSLRQEGNADF